MAAAFTFQNWYLCGVLALPLMSYVAFLGFHRLRKVLVDSGDGDSWLLATMLNIQLSFVAATHVSYSLEIQVQREGTEFAPLY